MSSVARPSSIPGASGSTRGASRLHAVIRHFGWRHELLRVAVVYLVYEGVRVLPSLHVRDAAGNGRVILRAEHWLGLAPERTLNQWLYDLPNGFAVGAAYYYEVLHYLVTPALLLWLFRRHTALYARARNGLVAMTLPSLLVFWLFPVVPPRLLGGADFHDIVADQHRWGWWSAGGTAPNGLGGLVNEFAAMPSLHVGWALWCAVQLVRHARHRLVRAAGALYPLITALVVMATGNHYLTDTLAGVAVAAFGGVLARAAERHGGAARSPQPPRSPNCPAERSRRRVHRSLSDRLVDGVGEGAVPAFVRVEVVGCARSDQSERLTAAVGHIEASSRGRRIDERV